MLPGICYLSNRVTLVGKENKMFNAIDLQMQGIYIVLRSIYLKGNTTYYLASVDACYFAFVNHTQMQVYLHAKYTIHIRYNSY